MDGKIDHSAWRKSEVPDAPWFRDIYRHVHPKIWPSRVGPNIPLDELAHTEALSDDEKCRMHMNVVFCSM